MINNKSRKFNVIMPITWLIAVIAMFMVMSGAREAELFKLERYILQTIYVIILLWYIIRSGPSNNLATKASLKSSSLSNYIGIILILFILLLVVFTNLGTPLLILILMITTFWVLIVFRKEIKLRMFVIGILAALIAVIGGFLLYKNNFVSQGVFIILPAFIPFMFVAGGLLIKRTNIGSIQLMTGNYSKSLKSFLWGCLLFIPLGMFNAASGSPGENITWVTDWWMPFVTPWFSGIVEETWYRLFLIGLCSLVLMPLFRKQPTTAIIISVLFSATVFGLGHGRTLDNFLTTGLLYGLPMAVVFVKRDWEHAVGAHYMINMIPMVMVFLETMQ